MSRVLYEIISRLAGSARVNGIKMFLQHFRSLVNIFFYRSTLLRYSLHRVRNESRVQSAIAFVTEMQIRKTCDSDCVLRTDARVSGGDQPNDNTTSAID